MEHKKKEQKLFVFDLDGTLLNSDQKVSKENFEAILAAKKAGHLIVIATGRNYIFAQDVLKEIWNFFDYYIGCNGALWHDIQNQTQDNSKTTIDFSFVEFVLEKLHKIGGGIQVSTFWNVYSEVYYINENQWFSTPDSIAYFQKYLPISKMSADDKKSIIQVSVHLEEHKVREFAKEMKELNGNMYDFSITSKYNVDINIKNLTKLTGILKVVNENNLSLENIFVFGDTQNDIPGLLYFENTFAMENALEETKKAAKNTIGNNNSNAIAQVVLKNI